MPNKYTCKILIFLSISLTLFGCARSIKDQEVLSKIEKKNNNFSVLLTSFREKRDFAQVLGGVDYLFQIKTNDDQNWKDIMVVNHDDGVNISEKNINFVGSEIAFVYVSNRYAITTDGGKTWNESKVKIDGSSCLISNMNIEPGGSGLLSLNCNQIRKQLVTDDYGNTWEIGQPQQIN